MSPINYSSPLEEWMKQHMDTFVKVLGSCKISFLFGAGVNGSGFPQFAQFSDTKEELDKVAKEMNLGEGSIEERLSRCSDNDKQKEVLEVFVNEFNSKSYNLDSASIVNLKNLLSATDRIVSRSETRQVDSKKINIFTLNYDRIVEDLLSYDEKFFYAISGDESKTHLPFNVVGYEISTRRYIPTFAIYKLHGSVAANGKLKSEGIVFPGQDKLGSVISGFYETLFAMKGELLKPNSVLFVIGYSWADEHINDVIASAIELGLTVYFLKYDNNNDEQNLPSKVKIIPAKLNENKQDTTKTLYDLFQEVLAR